MESNVVTRLSTLGHPQRLALFRLLMRRYPDRVPATELARALDLKPNTLSTYVGALMQAGLVTQERAGTSLRYAVDTDAVRDTFGYLLLDCCRGRPEICAPIAEATRPRPGPARKLNVLFLCTGNSARSIFAEALLRDTAGDRFAAYSAGTRPRAAPHPAALAVLARNGHDVSGLASKTVTAFQQPGAPAFDFVFTVCDRAANEDCPAWPGQPVSAHWGTPDPAGATGSEAEVALAFRQAYAALAGRIRAFAALPLDTLDRISLQRAVDAIGRQKDADTP